jgi:hypothetical protein
MFDGLRFRAMIIGVTFSSDIRVQGFGAIWTKQRFGKYNATKSESFRNWIVYNCELGILEDGNQNRVLSLGLRDFFGG